MDDNALRDLRFMFSIKKILQKITWKPFHRTSANIHILITLKNARDKPNAKTSFTLYYNNVKILYGDFYRFAQNFFISQTRHYCAQTNILSSYAQNSTQYRDFSDAVPHIYNK